MKIENHILEAAEADISSAGQVCHFPGGTVLASKQFALKLKRIIIYLGIKSNARLPNALLFFIFFFLMEVQRRDLVLFLKYAPAIR